MIAKSVIIIASGKATYAASGTLDQLIEAVTTMGKRPVLVIGPDGDDLMRSCAEIDSCEIVFDPNFDGEIFSGIKAGLHAVNSPAFVIPLAAEQTLEFSEWAQLETALRLRPYESKTHVIRPVTQTGDTTLYPQIVTAQGLHPLRSLPATTDWASSDEIQSEIVHVNTKASFGACSG